MQEKCICTARDNKLIVRTGKYLKGVTHYIFMKWIKVALDNKEFEVLDKCKNGLTWKEFFMMLAVKEVVEIVKKIEKSRIKQEEEKNGRKRIHKKIN